MNVMLLIAPKFTLEFGVNVFLSHMARELWLISVRWWSHRTNMLGKVITL